MHTNRVISLLILVICLAISIQYFQMDPLPDADTTESIVNYDIAENHGFPEATAPRFQYLAPHTPPPAAETSEEATLDSMSMVLASAMMVGALGAAMAYIYWRNRLDGFDPGTVSADSVVANLAIVAFFGIAALSLVMCITADDASASTVTISGTDGDDGITVAGTDADSFTVAVNGGPEVLYTGVTSLIVEGLYGDDTLTVDSTNGLISAPIDYDGGEGFDDLVLSGDVVDSASYTMGNDPSSGTNVISLAGATQTVNYSNIEPIQDNVVATTLTVNGTDANNAINYTAGPGGGIFTGPTGLVSVDDFETIEFNNKTTLILNGLAGNDTFDLNNSGTPAGLTSITVNGGSDDDTLTVDFNSGNPVPIDGVDFDGDGGDDELIVQGNGQDQITSRPSNTTANSGEIIVGIDSTITYTGLEPVTISRTPRLTFITGGSADDLVVESPSQFTTTISGTSDAVTFETHTLYNVGQLVIDARANDTGHRDIIVIDRPLGYGVDGAINESESNNSPGSADLLSDMQHGVGSIDPAGDIDYWRSPAQAGDLIFAYVDTQDSTDATDSVMEVLASDGVTVIEEDDDDGPGLSSVVAGAVAPDNGPIFFLVGEYLDNDTIIPYALYQAIVDPGDSAGEVEGNIPQARLRPFQQR